MAALTASSGLLSQSSVVSKPTRQSRVSRGRFVVNANLWTPNNNFSQRSYERPVIQANNQPLLAPRTAEMQGDPFGLLLRQRIIFMGGEVEDFSADAIISQLLLLDSQDPSKDIKMYINSPGQPQIADIQASSGIV